MNRPHEFMKVKARLPSDGDGAEKAIHQKAFSAANATIEPHATRHGRPAKQSSQDTRPLRTEMR
jgi:hypothetical protein